MSPELKDTGADPLERADAEAVYRHAFEGEPLDPAADRRIQERAARVTEGLRRRCGEISDEAFQSLLGDDDEL